MAVEQPKALHSPMASTERSKSFVKALQELKNLRPQLYSAAEYCEKSYLHSEQKQVVLDNLKEYAVRALVNAVDHLGTVAYKLSDLVEQQTSDVSTIEMKFSCLDQKLHTCQTYMDKEGLRQQQLLAIIPRHHKRYILPNSAKKKVHFSHSALTHSRHMHVQARPRVHPSGPPESKTHSWHLDSETKAPTKGPQNTVFSSDVQKASPGSATSFHHVDNETSLSAKSLRFHTKLPSSNPAGAAMQSSGATYKDTLSVSKSVTPFRASYNSRNAVIKAPVRRKSLLSALLSSRRN